ncbi:hypothetical protein BDD43_5350 [Mucilaginibacter gracilis]|uniref:Uncharacterized protein n=1 Tax=Mucilaginibacter gracilis TaxID=423350 RepID=A0A495J9L2_9SPHI|nr:hypothetical protein [Mucilaginibacter gracilis]RKR85094.1 hypothetical protein BDD43_5350 [Mucilaginibacter gracilis]
MKKSISFLLFLSVIFAACSLHKSDPFMAAGKQTFTSEASFVTEEKDDNRWVKFHKAMHGGVVFHTDQDSIIMLSYLKDDTFPSWGYRRVKKDVDLKYKSIPRHYLDYNIVGVYKQLIKPVDNYYQVFYYSPGRHSLLEVSYHGLIVNCVFLYGNTANVTNPFANPKKYFNMLKEEFPPEKMEVDSAYSTGVSN